MISPFDEAVMSPFIQEKSTAKKWNYRDNSVAPETTATTNMFEEGLHDDDIEEQALVTLATQDETVVFTHEDDIELAVLQERQEGIAEINQSMKQINSIQKDIASIVDSQSNDLERMSWNAIETFQNTQSGLEKVVQAKRYYQLSPKEQRERLIMAISGILVVMMIALYVLQPAMEDTASGDGSLTTMP